MPLRPSSAYKTVFRQYACSSEDRSKYYRYHKDDDRIAELGSCKVLEVLVGSPSECKYKEHDKTDQRDTE